ncbi:hypothetical protein DQ244_19050 [Blastococcus sp. TBT05-19]|nr:hypothetical protein DQ244_19050 [Blastococcus sp. TBT05-19]
MGFAMREQVHGEHGDDAAEHGQPQPQRDIHAETPASVGTADLRSLPAPRRGRRAPATPSPSGGTVLTAEASLGILPSCTRVKHTSAIDVEGPRRRGNTCLRTAVGPGRS